MQKMTSTVSKHTIGVYQFKLIAIIGKLNVIRVCLDLICVRSILVDNIPGRVPDDIRYFGTPLVSSDRYLGILATRLLRSRGALFEIVSGSHGVNNAMSKHSINSASSGINGAFLDCFSDLRNGFGRVFTHKQGKYPSNVRGCHGSARKETVASRTSVDQTQNVYSWCGNIDLGIVGRERCDLSIFTDGSHTNHFIVTCRVFDGIACIPTVA
jgi:hypothetical protein